MSDDVGDAPDDPQRAEKRRRDAQNARERRAERRRAREEAYAKATRDGTATGSNVVVALPLRVPAGVLLEKHLARLDRVLDAIDADESIALLDKGKLFSGATGQIAKGTETVEIRVKIEELERRLSRRGA